MPSYTEHVDSLMAEHSLDAYVTLTADCHMNEYQCPEDMRVKMLTGFTGSNGTAVTCGKNVLITDSRYYVQAANESSYPLFKGRLSEYIASQGFCRVGLDPRLISAKNFDKLKEKLEGTETEIVEITGQPAERPDGGLINLETMQLGDYLDYRAPNNSMENNRIGEYLARLGFRDLGGNVTGSIFSEKLSRVREVIGNKVLVVTELDTIAWMLNLRGSDIDYNPLFFAYLILTRDRARLFTNHSVSLEGIEVRGYSEFESSLAGLRAEEVVISGDCNRHIYSQFGHAEFTDVVRDMQACKNDNELAGMALAYFYDGVALTNLFGYMDSNDGYSESDIADRLHEYKKAFPGYIGPSFPTIAATGTNSVIVHHSSTDAIVDKSKALLLDCGSHYCFGTTDTSRTLLLVEGSTEDCIGREFRHDYTLVFKGHAHAMFKHYDSSSTYSAIDAAAREYLLAEGKDFGHATGHGVGHVLCVHEHPPTVSPNSSLALSSRHVFSVEPGYYREGFYGIRLENLVLSEKVDDSYVLRNITMVPYQTSILQREILTDEELAFLNAFNKECLWLLENFVHEGGRDFLRKNCANINK